jgi:hypothetical protein
MLVYVSCGSRYNFFVAFIDFASGLDRAWTIIGFRIELMLVWTWASGKATRLLVERSDARSVLRQAIVLFARFSAAKMVWLSLLFDRAGLIHTI